MSELVPILMYHSIAEDSAPKFRTWSLLPGTFARQMSYLRDQHYTPITVTQLAKTIADHSIPLPERPVVITFDDGLADFRTGALPILTEHHFAATLYIVTGYVGSTSAWLAPVGEGSRPMLTWSQIVEIQAAGVECGGHSVSHPVLDLVSRRSAQYQIANCKSQLEQHLGRAVESFSYPHGQYSTVTRRLVEQAGYTSACTVKHAMSATTDDRFALVRILVTAQNGTNPENFGKLLAGQGLPITPARHRLLSVGWRLARRSVALLTHRSSAVAIENAIRAARVGDDNRTSCVLSRKSGNES